MWPVLLLVLSATPIKVVAPDFQVKGVDPVVASTLFERLATQMSATGDVTITTSADVGRVLGLERQRQLLGCNEDSASCLAELAGALGADAVMSGSLVQAGSSLTVTLRIIDGRDGKELAAATTRQKDLDALQDWLDEQAPALVKRLKATHGATATAAPGVSTGVEAKGRSPWPWVTLGVSGAVLAAGVLTFALGKADYVTLTTNPPNSPEDIDVLAQNGQMKQQLGVGLMVAGGAGAVASLLWALLRPADDAVALVSAVPGGVFVGVSGRWP